MLIFIFFVAAIVSWLAELGSHNFLRYQALCAWISDQVFGQQAYEHLRHDRTNASDRGTFFWSSLSSFSLLRFARFKADNHITNRPRAICYSRLVALEIAEQLPKRKPWLAGAGDQGSLGRGS
jgi:hypothetical protein